jgi:predicted RNA binding protein YcfA (HicA-like mRNA interferase family)
VIVRQRGSHRQFAKGAELRTFAYHDSVELGSVQLRRIAAQFGLSLDELREAL